MGISRMEGGRVVPSPVCAAERREERREVGVPAPDELGAGAAPYALLWRALPPPLPCPREPEAEWRWPCPWLGGPRPPVVALRER